MLSGLVHCGKLRQCFCGDCGTGLGGEMGHLGDSGAGLTAPFPLTVLFAMKEGNEKVPTLLTDYILKGICSPCASLLHPSCILHAVPVKSLSPLCIHCGFLLHILVHPFCILVQLPRILHAPPVHPCASPMHLVCILHASPCIPCALSVHPLCILCESCVHLLCIPHASFVQALCILTHLCRSLHLPWTSLIPCYVVHPLPSCSLTNPCAPPFTPHAPSCIPPASPFILHASTGHPSCIAWPSLCIPVHLPHSSHPSLVQPPAPFMHHRACFVHSSCVLSAPHFQLPGSLT